MDNFEDYVVFACICVAVGIFAVAANYFLGSDGAVALAVVANFVLQAAALFDRGRRKRTRRQ